MFLRLFLLFTTIPLVEVALLIKLAQWTSVGTTFLIVITTGLLGAYLARREGIRALVRIQQSMGSGDSPTEAMWDAGMIVVAGIVLVTPGILTDIFGFSLLIPPIRRVFRQVIANWIKRHAVTIHHVNGFGGEDDGFIDIDASSTEAPDAPDAATSNDASHQRLE
ncbi:MAG: FxsA family protein [Planctomycetota bacterium]|jgi:UPF0716 protein FxsA